MIQKIFDSSEDPTKLSATVTGFVISAASYIIQIAAHYGVTITSLQVTEAATQLGIAIGGIWAAFGLIRKAVNAYRNRNRVL